MIVLRILFPIVLFGLIVTGLVLSVYYIAIGQGIIVIAGLIWAIVVSVLYRSLR